MTPSGRRPPSPSPGAGPPFPLFPNEKDMMMAKILVLYYSCYGHIQQMADAVADVSRAAGARVYIPGVAAPATLSVGKAAAFTNGDGTQPLGHSTATVKIPTLLLRPN